MVSGGLGRPTSPAVTGNTVYASWIDFGQFSFGGLEAVDATTGAHTVVFGDSNAPSNENFSGAAVANGTLYAVNGGILEAFDATGPTNCVPTTRQPLWQTNVGALVETSQAIGGEGHVYVTDTAGTLHAYGMPPPGS